MEEAENDSTTEQHIASVHNPLIHERERERRRRRGGDSTIDKIAPMQNPWLMVASFDLSSVQRNNNDIQDP